jgi:hypothetical protein
MAKKSELLTSAKFAKKTGLTTTAVSKLIRDGKIEATKKSGKWMIDPDQLNAKAVKATSKAVKAASKSGKPKAKKKAAKPIPKKAATESKKAAEPKADKPAGAQKSFSIAEFAGMTYLTERGVAEWLKLGRLTGSQDAQGDWRIDAVNLEAAPIKRLVRDA